ncbi:DUF305 domain-containing protein [uncultured Algimonas sp.]|uniref:DUF305 domain-containing protein n=1 Tax=uncultured Algimonas sp. TaxID=1547920 RepID=UPI002627C128|nr:DUF305 domain-containing protein [uncultured Algimonas sp.]
MTHYRNRLVASSALGLLVLGFGAAHAQDVVIVQPGAPGQPSQVLNTQQAATIAKNSYSRDDVRFMQDMIPHHSQAVEMVALIEARSNNEDVVDIGGRIDASQADEIEFMRNWLRTRGEALPGAHAHHGTHMSHADMGMATPAQMAELATLQGTAFDEMFLTLMIRHHEGAVDMVEDLLGQPGSAYDPVLYEFVNDITNDQTAEIKRMNGLLEDLSPDPRAALSAGFADAGEAISNLVKVASLPKPRGFFDPANPSGLPPIIEPDDEEEEAEGPAMDHAGHGADHDARQRAASAALDPERDDEQSNEETEWGERSPQLSFSNTDMAFSGDRLVVGNYHGFNIYDLSDDAAPKLVGSVVCPGGQGDVSIVGDLLIMSVEQTRGRVDCGREGVSEDVSEARFRGLRIFDIKDLARVRQVGQVQTCRGSHTHSVVSNEGGKIVVYNSGTASIRDGEELDGCVGAVAGDNRTALFRIDVIEIPVDDPSKARIVDSPAVFADEETGNISGLWQGGDHGEDTQRTNRTDHCHDITVFPSKKLAAGACSGNGVIFDISDPYKPKRIDAVVDQKFAYWHSATFNNDGTKVLFTDEWGGGSRPRCRPSDPKDWGANAIYDIVDGKLEFRSYYKIPAPQSEAENCVAHNGSIVPIPGRDIFAQAWYQGGLSLIDFTDSSNPTEIAYFDRGPVHEDKLVLGGYWSTYWYDGRIYGTEIVRGLDVFELKPSAHVSEAEIEAALAADQGELFNPQQQFEVTWPDAEPAVALAFVDQLERAGALDGNRLTALRTAVGQAGEAIDRNARSDALATQLAALASGLDTTDTASAARVTDLRNALTAMAARLRRT